MSSAFFLAFCSRYFYILMLTFQKRLLIFLLPFCLEHFRDSDARHSIFGICCMEYLWYGKKKKKKIHIIKNLFILLKKKPKKHTQQSTTSFCYYFNAILLCALMLWTSKHLPWLLYIFYMFFYFSDTLFFFHFFSFFLALVMLFDLFLKGRADWLSIFIGWKCLYSTNKHGGVYPYFFFKPE